MMKEIFVWIRMLIVIGIFYLFFYQHLYLKYRNILSEFDQFNWHDRFAHQCDLASAFNFTEKSITGKAFAANEKNEEDFYHVGEFSQYEERQLDKIKATQQEMNSSIISQFLHKLPFTSKKVDSYQFHFYNWYRFELTFTDIGLDSYLQFRLTQKKKGSHQIVEKIAFKLPQNFYSKTNQDESNKLNINYKAKGIQLYVQQYTVEAHYNDLQSDGLQQEKYFHLTQNKTQLTPEQFKKFGSAKTITKFNFTFERKDYEIRADVSHVIRHNQCVTNQQNGILRHKCMGGYGKGKINFSQFRREKINTNQNRYMGSWERNSYNLDNSRVRTIFVGQRFLRNCNIEEYLPKVDLNSLEIYREPVEWSYKSIEIDFMGFNKPQYYVKHDNIQKERWVGMTLHTLLYSNGAPLISYSPESYFFINGNIHPISLIDFQIPYTKEHLQNGNILTFTNNVPSNTTPTFSIELDIQNSTLVQQNGLWGKKQIYRIDGYWKGWIDEGTLFQNETLRNHYNATYQYGYVEFYQIEGTIKITQYLL